MTSQYVGLRLKPERKSHQRKANPGMVLKVTLELISDCSLDLDKSTEEVISFASFTKFLF